MKAIWNFGAKYGIIYGLIFIIYTLLVYITGPENLVSLWQGIVYFIITIGLFFFSAWRFKKEYPEEATFFKIFPANFLVFVNSGLITLLFNILFYHVIVPELPGYITDLTIEKTRSMMERFGAPEDEIEKAIKRVEENTDFSIVGMSKSYLWGWIFGAIIALITAAVFRKKENREDENSKDKQNEETVSEQNFGNR